MHKYKFTLLCIGWVRRARVQVVDSITYRDLVTAVRHQLSAALCAVCWPGPALCDVSQGYHATGAGAGLGWAGLAGLGWAGIEWIEWIEWIE